MDPKTILDTLKKASPFDLFLVSFIALPFVLDAWFDILNELNVGTTGKVWSLLVVISAYILGLVIMLVGANRQKKREIAKDQIISYLTNKNFEMMGVDVIRKNINSSYSNDFLYSLPVHFPRDIRFAKLKDGRHGLARILETSVEEEA